MGQVAVGFSGAKNGAWEIGLIRGIRETLGFEAEAGVFFGEEIPGVELDARLVGGDFKAASASGMSEKGSGGEFVRCVLQYPAVIVSVAEFEGGEVVMDALADLGGAGEIERGSFDRVDFAGRDEAGVGGKVGIGHEFEFMIESGGGEVPRGGQRTIRMGDEGSIVRAAPEVAATPRRCGAVAPPRDGTDWRAARPQRPAALRCSSLSWLLCSGFLLASRRRMSFVPLLFSLE